MVAPLFDLSLRSTQPCVFSAGTSNPDCATILFADSAETANSPKTARRAFCDRGAVRGRPCTIFPVHVRQTNKHAAGSDAQNEQRRAFGTEARDPHPRRAIEFPRTSGETARVVCGMWYGGVGSSGTDFFFLPLASAVSPSGFQVDEKRVLLGSGLRKQHHTSHISPVLWWGAERGGRLIYSGGKG